MAIHILWLWSQTKRRKTSILDRITTAITQEANHGMRRGLNGSPPRHDRDGAGCPRFCGYVIIASIQEITRANWERYIKDNYTTLTERYIEDNYTTLTEINQKLEVTRLDLVMAVIRRELKTGNDSDSTGTENW